MWIKVFFKIKNKNDLDDNLCFFEISFEKVCHFNGFNEIKKLHWDFWFEHILLPSF